MKLNSGQGHKVKDQGQIFDFGKKHLFRLYVMNQWLDTDVTCAPDMYIYINEMSKLTEGQGHKVKDQGQICKFI